MIAIYVYQGPSLTICGNPSFSITNSDGSSLPFLSATFDAVSLKITISLPIIATAIKGTYSLTAVFTQPALLSFDLGLNLKIFDICDNSYFEQAPILSPSSYNYYTGQSNLAIAVSYQKDFISRTTTNVCGTYSINAVLNSASSIIAGGPLDPFLTKLVVVNATNLDFSGSQPAFSGIIKYDVSISSNAFTTQSPKATWTVNIYTCDQKYRNWITASSPISNISYDIRNPPASTTIARYVY